MSDYLNLALVNSLRVILEEGSFRAAANRLHVTAPAMTQQIKRLEESLGFSVVRRGVQPVVLTDRGASFMVHAREALEASERALGIREKYVLRVGFINGYPRGQDEDFLLRFREQNPGSQLEFVQLNWGDQLTRLHSGEVDASLARPPYQDDRGVRRMVVHSEPRVVAVPSASALAAYGSLMLADIEGLPVVRAKGIGFEWTQYWVVDPRPSGAQINYGIWAATMEEALSAVAMSGNVMITAASVADRYVHPGVTYLPLDDVAYCHVELCTRITDRREAVQALRRSVG